MNTSVDEKVILEAMDKPAFYVQNGKITEINNAAKQYLIPPGEDIRELLITGQQEYEAFTDGSLYLSVSVFGTPWDCTVTRLSDKDLFTLEIVPRHQQLQTLARASAHLRLPLSDMVVTIERMDTKNDPMYPRLNRTIYQLQRIVSNMSDASLLLSTAPNLTECDICSPFREALEKATVLLKHAGIELKYSVPTGAIRGFAERDLISRAVYNLLSNAVKYAQAGEKLTAELTQKGKLLCFTVTGGQCKEPAAQEQFFKGYAREPGIAGYPSGLGLGITIVHTAASAHGGTVLVQQTPGQSTRVTMTLQIEKTGSSETVRTSILIPDSYGGRDSALVELSDVLPSSLYSGEF